MRRLGVVGDNEICTFKPSIIVDQEKIDKWVEEKSKYVDPFNEYKLQ